MSSTGESVEHIIAIERELTWMGLDGHLKDPDAQDIVNQILKLNHKLRKIFEENDRYDRQKKVSEANERAHQKNIKKDI